MWHHHEQRNFCAHILKLCVSSLFSFLRYTLQSFVGYLLFFFFFLMKLFQCFWVNFFIGIFSCLHLPVHAFHVLSLHHSLLSTSVLTWFVHHVYGLPLGLLHDFFMSSSFVNYLWWLEFE